MMGDNKLNCDDIQRAHSTVHTQDNEDEDGDNDSCPETRLPLAP